MFHVISQGRRTGKTHKVANTALEFLLSGKDVTVIAYERDKISDIIKTNINYNGNIKEEVLKDKTIFTYNDKNIVIGVYNSIKKNELFNDKIIVDELIFLSDKQIEELKRTEREIFCYTSGIFGTIFNKTCFDIIKKTRFYELDDKKADKYLSTYNLLVKQFGKEKTDEEIIKYQTSVFRRMENFDIEEISLFDMKLPLERVYEILYNAIEKYGMNKNSVKREIVGLIFENKEVDSLLDELFK